VFDAGRGRVRCLAVPLHPVVQEVVGAYLAAVDAEAAGVVEGLYLVGSVALDDFGPRSSDIDFVAVTADRPDAAAVAALARVHARLRHRRRPHFDGYYLTWDDLAADPAQAQRGPATHAGRFDARGGGPGDPVTWHTLARHGVCCRGPAQVRVWTDRGRLQAWCDANLDSYWRRWLRRSSTLRSPGGLFALTPYAAVWLVAGVGRIHYTLVTGDICGKAAAARHALDTFGERWQRVAGEALRIRSADLAGSRLPGMLAAQLTDYTRRGGAHVRPLYRTPLARRRDVLAFGAMAIADAHRVHLNRPQDPLP
jgi:hypothetical protein